MGLIQSYAIWNNKGGVGKSTITFHLASRYAELNPKKKVLVIDLCPQSNSSMMILGGGTQGESKVFEYCSLATPRTVVGYLSTVISNGAGAPLPNPVDYIVQVSPQNKSMPKNLYLFCGDGNLEPMAPAISEAAAARALTPKSQPWVWIHKIFKSFIENLIEVESETDWMIFVDTNPSFSIYTEIAMSSVNRIIAPVNADDSSRTAANAMAILLHGTDPPHPIYGSWTFATQAMNYGLQVPKIHLIVGNRLTQYIGAAAAFKAMSDATSNALFRIYKSNPEYFTNRGINITSVNEFRDNYSFPLRDFNTAGVVSAHLCNRLSLMKQAYYPVYANEVQVKLSSIKECLKAIDKVIQVL